MNKKQRELQALADKLLKEHGFNKDGSPINKGVEDNKDKWERAEPCRPVFFKGGGCSGK